MAVRLMRFIISLREIDTGFNLPNRSSSHDILNRLLRAEMVNLIMCFIPHIQGGASKQTIWLCEFKTANF